MPWNDRISFFFTIFAYISIPMKREWKTDIPTRM